MVHINWSGTLSNVVSFSEFQCNSVMSLHHWDMFLLQWIGDIRVVFRLCFKASPRAKPFIWKLVLSTRKCWFIYMWTKLVPYERLRTRTRLKQRQKAIWKSPIVQLKVDVGMLNTAKNYWADTSKVSPLSEQKRAFCCDEGFMIKMSAQ